MKKTVAGVLAVGVVWLTLTGSVWGEEILTLEKCIEAALKRSAEVRISRINLDQALLGVEKQEESKDWQAAFTSSFTRGFDNSFSYSKYYLATGEQDKIYNTEMFSSDFSNKVSISRSLKDYMTVNLYSKNTLTQGDGKSRKSGSMQESVLDQYPETVYETQKNYLEHGVELTIPLTGYERDKRMFDGDRNTFSVDSQELAYEKARHQVLEQVTAIYYSLVKNKMISGACQEEIDSFQKIIKLMNIQLERGMISVLDLQEQEIELQDKILKKDQAATDISLDCLKLSAETGFDINSKTQLVETFDLKPFRLDPAKVKELTFSNNR
ncbi:MAG: TolC family protein, partial [bacterium]|nr:TolC family protein [bacterium]